MNNDLISREALKEFINEVCFSKEWAKYRADKGTRGQIECILTYIDNAPSVEYTFEEAFQKTVCEQRLYCPARPQGESVIKCQDCKYRVKEWREDKRMKEKGYWVYGCKHFGEIMGYWGFGGNDNEFCSDAERKGGAV